MPSDSEELSLRRRIGDQELNVVVAMMRRRSANRGTKAL